MIRRRVAPLLLLPMLAADAPGQPPSPPTVAAAVASWVGEYADARLRFELRSDAAGRLAGTLRFDGAAYAATAQADGERLTGTFRAGADSFPYEARRRGDELQFVSGGTTYVLRRLGPPVNSPPAGSRDASAPSANAAASDAGTLVESMLGFSLRLPQGWRARETAEGVMLLPPGASFDAGREDNPELYLAALRHDYNPAEETAFARQLGEAFGQGGGTGGQRQAATFGPRKGAIYRWDLNDPQSGALAAFDVYLAAEENRVFVVLAAGERRRVRANDAAIQRVLATARNISSPPQAGGALADATPLAQRWLQKLRGKVVRQFWASQGMSSDKKHWLHADGSYEYASSSMVSVDVPGAGALSTQRGAARGRWHVRDLAGEVFLEVRHPDGRVERMPITEDNRNWYLNGEKAFAVDP